MDIEYFNDAELRAAEITFSPELRKLIFVESGLPVYQHHLDYKWICVMDPWGKIYAFKRGGARRHSSALRGGFVSSAVSLVFDRNGDLSHIETKTGHYWKGFKEPSDNWGSLIRELETRGMIFSRVEVLGSFCERSLLVIGVDLEKPSELKLEKNQPTSINPE